MSAFFRNYYIEIIVRLLRQTLRR